MMLNSSNHPGISQPPLLTAPSRPFPSPSFLPRRSERSQSAYECFPLGFDARPNFAMVALLGGINAAIDDVHTASQISLEACLSIAIAAPTFYECIRAKCDWVLYMHKSSNGTMRHRSTDPPLDICALPCSIVVLYDYRPAGILAIALYQANQSPTKLG